MGEIKSVKVDNWGVFFLQKLQNFFNKTDYCDLTLQFRDNSQLKVHRLVLSACTDYFNVLEQTCEVVDDAIIMPNGLQADVVVPIVNFMYTGTLEFELKMYNRLLRTAKDMNMTVLLKLLEAHRRTMEMHPQKTNTPTSPKARRKPGPQIIPANMPVNAGGRSLIQPNQGKRIIVGSNVNTNVLTQQQRGVPPGHTFNRITQSGPLPVKQIGSTTFTRIKQENEQETNTPTTGGYTLLKQSPQNQQQQPYQQHQQHQQFQSTPSSPFEQLRKGYNNNKRPAVSTFISPPAKKPNLEDVKEFAEQQRMRKQIAAEFGEDDYDASNIMDDDNIHNDDDDDEAGQAPQTSATSTSAGVQTSAQQQSEDPPGTTTIIVKHEGPDKPPTIVVKDNSNSKMNHAKIISEVLRQYPHLVRSNKNIKLKIMPNAGGQTQKIIVKKEPGDLEKSPTASVPPTTTSKLPTKAVGEKTLVTNIGINPPKTIKQPQISPVVKPNTLVTQSAANKTQAATATTSATTLGQQQQQQKRRIDSKTMHALIALGAENTTGPWLCLRCGRNGHPISIPSYRGFRRHLINTHKEIIDPALCEHCGWRSASKRELHFHMQLEHKVKTNLYIFPDCQICNQMCIDSDGLNQHLIDSHPDENKQQCIYCNKIFPEEIQLYTHMKTFHKKQAIEDGIIDYSDDENNHDSSLPMPPPDYDQDLEDHAHQQLLQGEQSEKKIKILSDISLPIASSIIKTDPFTSEAITEPTTSAVSEEYLQEHDHTETKFVAADGSEVILTDEQRKEILSQLNQEHDGSGVVMVLNEQQQFVGGDTQSEQGAISHDETSQGTTATNEEHQEAMEEGDQHDGSQIYDELKSQTSNAEEDSTSQTATAAEATNDEQELEEEHEQQEQPEHLDESKESIDNLEWAENLISEHDMADEVSQTTAETTESNKQEEKEEEPKEEDNKSQDEISKKLKELTGDWSEDDDEDMPEEELIPEEAQPEKIDNEGKKGEMEIQKEKENIEDVEMAEPEEEAENLEKNQELKPEEEKIIEEEPQELVTLEPKDKEETEKENKEKADLPKEVSQNIDEDDIDLALKSLHKEDVDIDENKKMQEAEKDQSQEKDDEKKEEKDEKDNDKKQDNKKQIEIPEEKDEKKEEPPKESETEVKDEKSVEDIKSITEETECSSVMDVDEETKKDLIDSLLKEQPEAAEDIAIETPSSTIKADEKIEDDSVVTEEKESKTTETVSQLTESEPPLEDDFLGITPDKIAITDEQLATTSTSAATAEGDDVSSNTATAKDTISSEDRVKSLISEWGDDDEDEDDNNDTDLTANL